MRFLVSLSLPSNKMEHQCSWEWAKGTMTTWLFLTNLLKKEGWDLSENRFKWKEFESKLLTMKQFKCSCDASLMFKRPGAVAIQQALPCHFFFPPSLFRSSSIISSIVSMVNKFICSWILESGNFWRSWASQYPDWKLKWPKSCVVSLAVDIDCAIRNFSTRGMLCHIPWQDKHGPEQSKVQKTTQNKSHIKIHRVSFYKLSTLH